LASQSGGSEVLAGDGVIGDSTGITTTQGLTTAGITRGAEPFTTGAVLPEGRPVVGDLPAVLGQRQGLSREIGRRPADTLHRAARAAYAQAPLAATVMAVRRGVIPRAEAAAWVAEAHMAEGDLTAAAADGGNRAQVVFLRFAKLSQWRKGLCSERS
jgi:hypothetical protein